MKSTLFRRRNIVIAVILLLVIAGAAFAFTSGNGQETEVYTVQRETVRQEVSVSGTVKSSQSASLGFSQSGRIGISTKKVGDTVLRGETIVSLENQDEYASQLQASARLQSAQASLREVERGTRSEELAIKEQENRTAKIDLVNAINEAYSDVVGAVTSDVDTLFENGASSNNRLLFIPGGPLSKTDIQRDRTEITRTLLLWQRFIAGTTIDNAEERVAQSQEYLSEVRSFVEDLAIAVNRAQTNDSTGSAEISAYRSAVVNARGQITAAISNLQSASQAVTVSARELALSKAGSSVEDIDVERANVAQAQAELVAAQAQYEKTIIRAPFDGVVTLLDVDQGEIVSGNQAIVSVISQNAFIVETNIPEVDIAKVALNNEALITLDAYGDSVVFPATIVLIDPGATVIDGVPSYKTTLQFTTQDERIRSGMTANVTIVGSVRNDVVAIPLRAIEKNTQGQDVVNVQQGNDPKNTVERVITVGLRGSNGKAEVLSGLNEGDVVVMVKQ